MTHQTFGLTASRLLFYSPEPVLPFLLLGLRAFAKARRRVTHSWFWKHHEISDLNPIGYYYGIILVSYCNCRHHHPSLLSLGWLGGLPSVAKK